MWFVRLVKLITINGAYFCNLLCKTKGIYDLCNSPDEHCMDLYELCGSRSISLWHKYGVAWWEAPTSRYTINHRVHLPIDMKVKLFANYLCYHPSVWMWVIFCCTMEDWCLYGGLLRGPALDIKFVDCILIEAIYNMTKTIPLNTTRVRTQQIVSGSCALSPRWWSCERIMHCVSS